MVRLGRLVRFSVNPFLDADEIGANAYTARPAGAGLAVFLELGVALAGPVDPATGFLVNVTDIDRAARRRAVPIFADHVRRAFARGEHVGLHRLAALLAAVREALAGEFGNARLSTLSLKLNPSRELTMNADDPGTILFSEKFEFAAMHKLWNDSFSEQRNIEVFGKCANPTGHGHNYIVEVTVAAPAAEGVEIGRFERTVDAELIRLVDHKNLNLDVPEFGGHNPTVENLATFAWSRLAGRFDPAHLHAVTVWESDRTYCTYHGPNPS
jgi:6-pyruvoyltetrahydropterin/6-carboxytetrahydropterin synthase